jgi:predicted phosphodiesterase
MKIRIISDVHGQGWLHKDMLSNRYGHFDYSVQIGDLGFKYDYLKDLDSNVHKFFGGNHDNYNLINNVPHNLGDFGQLKFGDTSFNDVFFMRGAYSIDKSSRIEGLSWWPEEEMSYSTLKKCIKEYKDVRPKYVLSHTCPGFLVSYLIGANRALLNTKTNEAMDQMFDVHQPQLWVFGHFHMNFMKIVGNTTFLCLKDDTFMDLEIA